MFYVIGIILILAPFLVDASTTLLKPKDVPNKVDVSEIYSKVEITVMPTMIPTLIPSPKPTKTIQLDNKTDEITDIKDLIIDCKCGDIVKLIKSSECNLLVCCNSEDKIKMISAEECQKKKDEKYKKMLNEYEKRINGLEKANTEVNQQLQEQVNNLDVRSQEIKSSNLDLCRRNAQEKYKQSPMGSRVGTGLGYVVGESPELRQRLNAELQRCLDLYGQ